MSRRASFMLNRETFTSAFYGPRGYVLERFSRLSDAAKAHKQQRSDFVQRLGPAIRVVEQTDSYMIVEAK